MNPKDLKTLRELAENPPMKDGTLMVSPARLLQLLDYVEELKNVIDELEPYRYETGYGSGGV